MPDNTPDEPALTVRQLLFQIVQEVRDLDKKVDEYIEAHARHHQSEDTATLLARTDPSSTALGRMVLEHRDRIQLLEKRNDAEDVLMGDRRQRTNRRDWVVGVAAGIVVALVHELVTLGVAFHGGH